MVSEKTVEYVAELSRIKIDTAQIPAVAEDLSKIVQYMEVLKAAETDDIEPLSHVFSITNVLRADEVQKPFERDILLENAPSRTEEAFVVPKTV